MFKEILKTIRICALLFVCSMYFVGAVSSYAATFNDVPDDSYYSEAVEWCYINGITSGVGNHCFGPEQRITTKQYVIMLERTLGENGVIPSYDDQWQDYAQTRAWYRHAAYFEHHNFIADINDMEISYPLASKYALAIHDVELADLEEVLKATNYDGIILCCSTEYVLNAQYHGWVDANAAYSNEPLTRGDVALLLYNIAQSK